MASTYTLIASNVLGSSAASVTFSAIPATYTDLVVRWSARNNAAGRSEFGLMRLNGSTSAIYSETWLSGQNTTAYSERFSGYDRAYKFSFVNGSASASNTFSSSELYIPSYTVSQNKPYSHFNVMQDNQTATMNTTITADLFRSTSAITSIEIYGDGGTSFVSGSSFYLYGIKNS
jgi:hypothetical protein